MQYKIMLKQNLYYNYLEIFSFNSLITKIKLLKPNQGKGSSLYRLWIAR